MCKLPLGGLNDFIDIVLKTGDDLIARIKHASYIR